MRLLAVTVLTSLSKEDLVAAGEDRTPHQLVSMRAELALEAGIDGAVCAVEEAAIVRARAGDGFTIVCPGIRPSGQARATSAESPRRPTRCSRARTHRRRPADHRRAGSRPRGGAILAELASVKTVRKRPGVTTVGSPRPARAPRRHAHRTLRALVRACTATGSSRSSASSRIRRPRRRSAALSPSCSDRRRRVSSSAPRVGGIIPGYVVAKRLGARDIFVEKEAG